MPRDRRSDRHANGILVIGTIYYILGIVYLAVSYFAFSYHVVAGIAAILLAALQFVVGYGLRNFRKWGWEIAVANACLTFFNCPLGTIVSLFAFHYLFKGRYLFR